MRRETCQEDFRCMSSDNESCGPHKTKKYKPFIMYKPSPDLISIYFYIL